MTLEESKEYFLKCTEGYKVEIDEAAKKATGSSIHDINKCSANILCYISNGKNNSSNWGIKEYVTYGCKLKRNRLQLRLLINGISPREAERRAKEEVVYLP
jgi:hypothetical protein